MRQHVMNQQKNHSETLQINSSCFVLIDLVSIQDAVKGVPPNVVVELVSEWGYRIHEYALIRKLFHPALWQGRNWVRTHCFQF